MPLSRGDRLRAVAPAALLAVVAAVGVVRSATIDQSSWQGASFGMFATYDNATSRQVVLIAERAGSRRRISLPEDLRDDARRLRVVPTSAGADDLAAAVLAHQGADTDRVRVELWRVVLREEGGLRMSWRLTVQGSADR